MKKLLVALALAASLPAQAKEVLAVTAEGGLRYTIHTETFRKGNDSAWAMFTEYGDGVRPTQKYEHAFGCSNDEGPLEISRYYGDRWTVIFTGYWTRSGDRVVDIIGTILCRAYADGLLGS